MAKKFENKKMNKEDHSDIEKQTGTVRKILGGFAMLISMAVAINKIPWKRVEEVLKKNIFKT